MSDIDDTATLSPTQAEVLDRLGATRDERPTFPPGLRERLRESLTDAIADLAVELDPDDPLTVNKHDLSTVHGCEVRYLSERDRPFEWSPPLARGTVAHKAIELSLHERSRPIPLV
ncbi:MAG: hypothetical protein FGM58_09915, partial [Acidimicrobiia bacterium]|nr:hypothetical protein [Acidimicrobiia bacterium]